MFAVGGAGARAEFSSIFIILSEIWPPAKLDSSELFLSTVQVVNIRGKLSYFGCLELVSFC